MTAQPTSTRGTVLDIYVVAIGGTGMAPLACLLQELGHRVRGVDKPLYPPMSTLLADAGIEPLIDYDAAHLEAEDAPKPDLIVVGNAVPRTNPEAEAAERLRGTLSANGRPIEILSMPETLARFFLAERRPLVVSGTHGKTTTSSIAAWVLTHCGQDPGYLVGGIPRNLARSFAVGRAGQSGRGGRFVVEGDEYNAAYFDRGPKFLHYQPHTLILTSVEYDHADLYPSPEVLHQAYRKLVGLVPADGLIVAYGDHGPLGERPPVPALVHEALAGVDPERRPRVLTYGFERSNDVHPVDLETTADGSRFRVEDPFDGEPGADAVTVDLRVPGEHNLVNALAVWTTARFDGLPAAEVAAALGAFDGAKRRLEELGTRGGVTVVDDFAHHPTAIAKSLGGLRQRYPGRRIVLCFEPRSLTAGRAFFADAYRRAFTGADAVLFAPIQHEERLRREGHEVLDLDALVADLRAAGVDARRAVSTDDLLSIAEEMATDGDVFATMSSGGFDGLPQRLLAAFTDPGATP